MNKSLEGLRVLELSQFISAPYAGQVLADFGAEVIKIELPGDGNGDIARKFDPIYKDMSLYFASYNRNKKFITLDLKNDEGRQIFKEMVKISDVVIENFRPGVMEKMGLSYEKLKEINPAIILASLSGFGQNGPNSKRQALDMSIQALCGFMDLTGFEDGPPTKGGPVLSDFIGGLYLVVGILIAYEYRNRTGYGQHIDIALFDSMFVLLENFPSIYYMSGDLPKRSGNGRPFSAPVGTFKTKDDKWIQISGTAEIHFVKLAKLIGIEKLVGQPNMIGAAVRKKNERLINREIEKWLSSLTAVQAANELDINGIPNAIVQTVEEVINDPQVKNREMLVKPKETILDEIPVIGNPIKLSETPAEYNTSAMPQGADNNIIYQKLLGFSHETITKLKEKKII